MSKTETKSTVLLQHHLKALKLPTMLAECAKVAGRCAAENVDHLGFLLQLCELELIDRERRAAERRLKAAKFPNHKTLDAFDFKAQPSLNKALVSELMRGEYIDKRENILLVGNSGTGKTHVATALGIAACGQGKRVRFFQVTELITQLMEAREDHDLTRLKKQLSKLDLLILDDMGMKQLPRKSGEFLFEIIMRRHELRSTMMTSNRPLEDWGKLIGDVPAATAILDRFLQDAEVIQITGRSYRLRGRSADEKEASSKPAKPANGKSKSGQTRKPAQT